MGWSDTPTGGLASRESTSADVSFLMSNFAAMSVPVTGLLSAASKATSEIIDGFLKANYGFLELSVKLRIWLDPKRLTRTVEARHKSQGLGRDVHGVEVSASTKHKRTRMQTKVARGKGAFDAFVSSWRKIYLLAPPAPV
jgi:hypothetical protein